MSGAGSKSPDAVVYCRLTGQAADLDAQLAAARSAGFVVGRTACDMVLASTPARRRPALLELMKQLGPGDRLVTQSIDGLGRDAGDVVATLEVFRRSGVSVFCLALGRVSLTGAGSSAILTTLRALAGLDAQVLHERTEVGQARVRTWTGATGRPPLLDLSAQLDIVRQRRAGVSLAALARQYGVSRSAIQRVEKRLDRSGDDPQAFPS